MQLWVAQRDAGEFGLPDAEKARTCDSCYGLRKGLLLCKWHTARGPMSPFRLLSESGDDIIGTGSAGSRG